MELSQQVGFQLTLSILILCLWKIVSKIHYIPINTLIPFAFLQSRGIAVLRIVKRMLADGADNHDGDGTSDSDTHTETKDHEIDGEIDEIDDPVLNFPRSLYIFSLYKLGPSI